MIDCALFGALLLSLRQRNVARLHGQAEATMQLGLVTCSPCICVVTITTFITHHARDVFNSCVSTPILVPTLPTFPTLFTRAAQTDLAAADTDNLDTHQQLRQVLFRTAHTQQSVENIRGRLTQTDHLYGVLNNNLHTMNSRVAIIDDRTSRLKGDMQTFQRDYSTRLPRYVEASNTIVT